MFSRKPAAAQPAASPAAAPANGYFAAYNQQPAQQFHHQQQQQQQQQQQPPQHYLQQHQQHANANSLNFAQNQNAFQYHQYPQPPQQFQQQLQPQGAPQIPQQSVQQGFQHLQHPLQHQFNQQYQQQPSGQHPIQRQSSFTGLPPVRRASTLNFDVDLSALTSEDKGKTAEGPTASSALPQAQSFYSPSGYGQPQPQQPPLHLQQPPQQVQSPLQTPLLSQQVFQQPQDQPVHQQQQNFLPKGNWVAQESRLQEPLAETRHRYSPSSPNFDHSEHQQQPQLQQHEAFSFEKETGLTSSEALLTRRDGVAGPVAMKPEDDPEQTLASPTATRQLLPQQPAQQPFQAQQQPQQHQQQLPPQPTQGSQAPLNPQQVQLQQQFQQQLQQQQFIQQQQAPMSRGTLPPDQVWTQQQQPQQQPQPQQPVPPTTSTAPSEDKGRRFTKISSWRLSTPPSSSHGTKAPQFSQKNGPGPQVQQGPGTPGPLSVPSQLSQGPPHLLQQYNPQAPSQLQLQHHQDFPQQQQQQQKQLQQHQQGQPSLSSSGKKLRGLLAFGKSAKGQQQQPHGQRTPQSQSESPIYQPYSAQVVPSQGVPSQGLPQGYQQQGAQQRAPHGFQGPPQDPQDPQDSRDVPQQVSPLQGSPTGYQVSPQSRQATPQNFQTAQQGFQQPSLQQTHHHHLLQQQQQQQRHTSTSQTSAQPTSLAVSPPPAPQPQSPVPTQTPAQQDQPDRISRVSISESSIQDTPVLTAAVRPVLTQSATPVAILGPTQPPPQQQQQQPTDEMSPTPPPVPVSALAPTQPAQLTPPPNQFQAPRDPQPGPSPIAIAGAPVTGAPGQQLQQRPGQPQQQYSPQQLQQQQFALQQQLRQHQQQHRIQQTQQAPQSHPQQQPQHPPQLHKHQTAVTAPLPPPDFFKRTQTFSSIIPDNTNRRSSGLLSGFLDKVRGKDKDKSKIETAPGQASQPSQQSLQPGQRQSDAPSQPPQESMSRGGPAPPGGFNPPQQPYTQDGRRNTGPGGAGPQNSNPRQQFPAPQSPFGRPRASSHAPSLTPQQQQQQSPNTSSPDAANTVQAPGPSPSPLSIVTDGPAVPANSQAQTPATAGPGSSVGPTSDVSIASNVTSATSGRASVSSGFSAGTVDAIKIQGTSPQSTTRTEAASSPGPGPTSGPNSAVSPSAGPFSGGRPSVNATTQQNHVVGQVPIARGRIPSASGPPGNLSRKPVGASPLQQQQQAPPDQSLAIIQRPRAASSVLQPPPNTSGGFSPVNLQAGSGSRGPPSQHSTSNNSRMEKEMDRAKKIFGRFRRDKNSRDFDSPSSAGPPPGGPQYPASFSPNQQRPHNPPGQPSQLGQGQSDSLLMGPPPGGPRSSVQQDRRPSGQTPPSGPLPSASTAPNAQPGGPRPNGGSQGPYLHQGQPQFPNQAQPNSGTPNGAAPDPAGTIARAQALQQQIPPADSRPPQSGLGAPLQQQPPQGWQQQVDSRLSPVPQPGQQRPQQQQQQQQPQQVQQRPPQQQQRNPQQQQQPEEQYDPVPVPQGYTFVRGEGSVAPSLYGGPFPPQQQRPQQLQQPYAPQQIQYPPEVINGVVSVQQYHMMLQSQQLHSQQLVQQQWQGQHLPQQPQPGQQWSPVAVGIRQHPNTQGHFVQGPAPVQQQVAPTVQLIPQPVFQAAPASPSADVSVTERDTAPTAPVAAISPETVAASPEAPATHPLQQHPVSYMLPPTSPTISHLGREMQEASLDTRREENKQAETDTEDDLEYYEEPVVEEAVVAPLRASPAAVVIPLPPVSVQQTQERETSEPSPISQLLPQINGLLASTQADIQASSSCTDQSLDAPSDRAKGQATSAAPSEIFFQTAKPILINGNHTAEIVSNVAPLSPPQSPASLSPAPLSPARSAAAHSPGHEHVIYNGCPVTSAPLLQPIESEPDPAIFSAPVTTTSPEITAVTIVTPPVATADATSSFVISPDVPPTAVVNVASSIEGAQAAAAAAERDVHDITPPSPIDNMDYDLGAGAAPSATDGLFLPYGGGGATAPADNSEGSSGGDLSRQKTIRQTPQQEFEEYKRRQMLKDLEEKIPVFVPEVDEELETQRRRSQEEPAMSATSYPGQEWNPYGSSYVDED